MKKQKTEIKKEKNVRHYSFSLSNGDINREDLIYLLQKKIPEGATVKDIEIHSKRKKNLTQVQITFEANGTHKGVSNDMKDCIKKLEDEFKSMNALFDKFFGSTFGKIEGTIKKEPPAKEEVKNDKPEVTEKKKAGRPKKENTSETKKDG